MIRTILLLVILGAAFWWLWRRLPVRSAVATIQVRRSKEGGYAAELTDSLSGADRARLLEFLNEMDWDGPGAIIIRRGTGQIEFRGRIGEGRKQRVRNFVVNCLNVK